jgi:hypothetical protein
MAPAKSSGEIAEAFGDYLKVNAVMMILIAR